MPDRIGRQLTQSQREIYLNLRVIMISACSELLTDLHREDTSQVVLAKPSTSDQLGSVLALGGLPLTASPRN